MFEAECLTGLKGCENSFNVTNGLVLVTRFGYQTQTSIYNVFKPLSKRGDVQGGLNRIALAVLQNKQLARDIFQAAD